MEILPDKRVAMKDGKYILDNFPQAFNAYVREWRALEDEYYRIPNWRTFKQLSNIRKREKLTKAYIVKMRGWGLIP